MSKYTQVKLEMNNLPSMVEALLSAEHPCRTTSWKQEEVEVHLEDTPKNRQLAATLNKRFPQLAVSLDGPVHLRGYAGDRRQQKAHIRINRKHVQSSANDIGVFLSKEGAQLHVSAFDKSNFNKAWQNKVVQHYGLAEAKLRCRREGWNFQEKRAKNGAITLEIQVP